MKKIYSFCLAFFFAVSASATQLQFDPNGNIKGSVSDKTAQTIADLQGALDRQAGNANVPTPNGTVRVPVSTSATLSKARIAGAALGCTTVVGAAVCAATAAQVAQELKDAGVGYGPCPAGSEQAYAFICKPAQRTETAAPKLFTKPGGTTTGDWVEASNAVCAAAMTGGFSGFGAGGPLTYTFSCAIFGGQWQSGYSVTGQYYCVEPAVLNGNICVTNGGEMVPVPTEEIQQTLQQRLDADYHANRRLAEALKADQAAAQAAGIPRDPSLSPYKPDTPVTVTAPPVTTPEKTVKTETRQNPDGSTDTVETRQRTTVTPTTSGSTIGDSKTTFPSQTLTTTIVTNNVTNNVTTNTTVENHDAPEEDQPEDVTFNDTAMPPVPELYEQKYPDGLTGVWNANKPNISDTQFWQGVKQMFPSFSSGSCPSWSMGFNILPSVSLGTHGVSVPCWIFQAVGLIILTTAAFTARKIIF